VNQNNPLVTRKNNKRKKRRKKRITKREEITPIMEIPRPSSLKNLQRYALFACKSQEQQSILDEKRV